MIEKIRTLTTCVSPGGEGHVVLWKGMKKHTGNCNELNVLYMYVY